MQLNKILDFLGLAFVLAIITTIFARPTSAGVFSSIFGGLSGLIKSGMTVPA